MADYNRQYRAENREKILTDKKDYYRDRFCRALRKQENKENPLARQAERAKRITAYKKKAWLKWAKNNKSVVAAHRQIRKACYTRELVAQPCEICGKKPVHAHHEDYNKPLQVRWLCSMHHKAWHRVFAATPKINS